jgi:hypothetical protein
MAQTIAQLRKETLKLLNEATNSTLGVVSSGTGTVAVGNESDASINQFLMEGIAEMCRTCVAIPAVGTYTVGANTRTFYLKDVAVSNPVLGAIWFPTDVYISGTRLIHASESSVRANDLTYASAVTSVATDVQYWYRYDNYAISLYPYNSTTSMSTTVHGYGVPNTDLTGIAGTDDLKSYSFIPDDLLRQTIPAYAAVKLVLKNLDDPTLAERMTWRNWYNEGRMKLYLQLDSGLRQTGGPFAIPPVMGQG